MCHMNLKNKRASVGNQLLDFFTDLKCKHLRNEWRGQARGGERAGSGHAEEVEEGDKKYWDKLVHSEKVI